MFITFPKTTQVPVVQRDKRDIGKEIITIVTIAVFYQPAWLKRAVFCLWGRGDIFTPLPDGKHKIFDAGNRVAVHRPDSGGCPDKTIMGRFSDRRGRVPIIISGLVLGGIVTAALSLPRIGSS